MQKLIVYIYIAAGIFLLVTAPIILLANLVGISASTENMWLFYLLTLADIALLTWRKREWSRRVRNQVIAAVLIAAILLAGMNYLSPAVKQLQKHSRFNTAAGYIAEGKYDAAYQYLEKHCGNNAELEGLMYLCCARQRYDEGNVEGAKAYVDYYLHYVPQKLYLESEKAFIMEVNAAYAAWEIEQQEAQEREYERKIKYRVPFEGMSELRIEDTVLGIPVKIENYNSVMIKGERRFTTGYKFYQNKKLVFIAICLDGRVHSTADFRGVDFGTYIPPEKKEDPFNASDYSYEDDFYNENYDDFYDFEDAEDYYFEYGN